MHLLGPLRPHIGQQQYQHDPAGTDTTTGGVCLFTAAVAVAGSRQFVAPPDFARANTVSLQSRSSRSSGTIPADASSSSINDDSKRRLVEIQSMDNVCSTRWEYLAKL